MCAKDILVTSHRYRHFAGTHIPIDEVLASMATIDKHGD